MKHVKDTKSSRVFLCAGKAKHAERSHLPPSFGSTFCIKRKGGKQPMVKNATTTWTFEKVHHTFKTITYLKQPKPLQQRVSAVLKSTQK